MRSSFAKRLGAAAMALSLAAAWTALPAFAEMPAEDEKGVVVTFRPGMEDSRFTEEYLSYLESASLEVSVSQATGSVAVLLPAAGARLDAPLPEDVIVGDSRYAVTDTAPDYDPEPMFSAEYVVQYGMVPPDGALAYSVEFRDRGTGAEVAPGQKGVASEPGTLTIHAPSVKHFKAEKETAELKISAEGENRLVMYYEGVPIEKTRSKGKVIHRYNDIVIQVGAAQAPATGSAAASGTGGKVINPESVKDGEKIPQTGGKNVQPAIETVTAPNADAATAAAVESTQSEETGRGFSPLLIVGIGLIAVFLAAAFFLKGKKDGVSRQ